MCAPLTEENELVDIEKFSFLPLPKELLMIIVNYLGCEITIISRRVYIIIRITLL